MKKNKLLSLLAIGVISCGIFSGCSNEVLTETTTELTETTTEQQTPSVSEEKKTLAPSEDLYVKVEKMNESCERYYKTNKEDAKFYTWAGFLSYAQDDTTTLTEVSPKMLIDLGYLNDKYYIENSFNLYMRPVDIDKNFKKSNLDIFTAVETSDGFIVYNKEYGRKLIPSENFRKTLLSYNTDNGVITNPKTGSEVYNLLMNAIKEFRKDEKVDYVVRYVCNNDMYAVVILSPTSDVTDTTQYLLNKENNKWSVLKNGLENIKDIRVELNKEYPNFELKILPPYTLYEYRKQVRTTEHYQDILKLIKDQKIIDANDTVTYCCGTQTVLYFEFASGKKLAGGATKDNRFSCNLVNNYEEAIKELGRFGQPVPAFILKYNK